MFNNERKSRSSRTSLLEKRRPLKTVHLTQAGLKVEFNNLRDESNYYVEFEAKYLGDIPGVPFEVDTTNRTEVLKIIDRGKKQGMIPLQISHDHSAVLYLSKYVVKVTKRDGQEEEIMQLPLHEIAQLCYIQEEGLHILAIKHGTPDRLNLAILLCDDQITAEGICSLQNQCFHLVYNEVMIELIEDTIDKTLTTENSRSQSSDGTPTESKPPAFMSSSNPNIPIAVEPFGRAPHSDISRSSQEDLLRVFMWQLQHKLKPEELKTFSELLKDWNYSSNKLQYFCNELYKLFGAERKYLLPGMYPFIPERDCAMFENFLKSHNINLPDQGTFSSLQGYPPKIYTRSISDISIHSTTNASSDLDLTTTADDINVLEAIGKNLEQIDLSVGDPAPKYLPNYDKNSKI